MTLVTCRLTARNRDQLRNPTLGNRVWATLFAVVQEHCEMLLQRLDSVDIQHLTRHDLINVMILRHDLQTFISGYDTIL